MIIVYVLVWIYLNPISFENFMTNISKIVKRGIYIQDLLEHFPGGFQEKFRNGVIQKRFQIKEKYKIFNQPFNKKLLEPVISAILLVQNLYAEKD